MPAADTSEAETAPETRIPVAQVDQDVESELQDTCETIQHHRKMMIVIETESQISVRRVLPPRRPPGCRPQVLSAENW